MEAGFNGRVYMGRTVTWHLAEEERGVSPYLCYSFRAAFLVPCKQTTVCAEPSALNAASLQQHVLRRSA